MHHSEPSRRARGRPPPGLTTGLAVGLGFLALSFIRIAGDANSALLGGRVLDAILDQPLLGTKLGLNTALFAASLLAVHLALGVLGWGLACLSPAAWPHSRNGIRAWTLLWSLLLILWVLAANARWFPSSSLGFPYAGIAAAPMLGLSVFAVVSLVVWGAAILTLIRHVVNRGAATRPALIAVGGSACVALSVALITGPVSDALAVTEAESGRPSVILIGLDSLRPDHVGTRAGNSLTPEIDRFLAGAVRFPDAVTPLARTFPSWVSVLSGKHPHTTGAVINLFPRELIDDGETLGDLLGANGYETIYGIDEVRFSNIDESYGFDKMISPPIGSADFLIGHFADTPLSNLLINTFVGRFLFPQIHGNRAMAVTYDPDSFIKMLDRGIRPAGPSLVAVHFTLPHWPYTWASGPAFPRATAAIDEMIEVYPASVTRVDRQFGDLMNLLAGRGVLENAIVVLFSDHGESLGESPALPGTGLEDELVYGHGTDVFAADQYDVLLAIRSYGSAAPEFDGPAEVAAPVSLEDVLPTVAEALNLDVHGKLDGQSLLPMLSGSAAGPPGRVRFIETEFNPPGLDFNEITRLSEFEDAANSYRIDPDTDRVLVREEKIDGILANRQYAVLRDGHLFASLPVGEGETQNLVFAPAGSPPVWLTRTPDPAESPLASELWELLAQRFEPVRARRITAP